ncbi:MAG: DUF4199 domain-containing protein [Bacteroidota bacterium]
MIKWGAIKGVVAVVSSMLAIQFMGNVAVSLLTTLIGIATPVLILLFAFKEYKSINEGFMALKEAIVLGLGIYLVEFLVSFAWNLLYSKVINPGFQEEAMDAAMDQLEQTEGMSDGMLDMFMGMTEASQSIGFQIAAGLGGVVIFGLFWSLIMGLIMRKERVA